MRGGLAPDDDAIVRICRRLQEDAELRGVMTHAGGSYGITTGAHEGPPLPSRELRLDEYRRAQFMAVRSTEHSSTLIGVRMLRHLISAVA
jgi:hypothetical protein